MPSSRFSVITFLICLAGCGSASPGIEPGRTCTRANQCLAGEYCGASDLCLPIGGCAVDLDCERGEECVAGFCELAEEPDAGLNNPDAANGEAPIIALTSDLADAFCTRLIACQPDATSFDGAACRSAVESTLCEEILDTYLSAQGGQNSGEPCEDLTDHRDFHRLAIRDLYQATCEEDVRDRACGEFAPLAGTAQLGFRNVEDLVAADPLFPLFVQGTGTGCWQVIIGVSGSI